MIYFLKLSFYVQDNDVWHIKVEFITETASVINF